MTHWQRTLGPQGVDPHDAPAAVRARQLLRWPLFAALVLLAPAFYLELIGPAVALVAARCLYGLVRLTCMGVLGRLLALTRHRSTFLQRNAMDAGLALAALVSIVGATAPWSATEWVLKLLFIGARSENCAHAAGVVLPSSPDASRFHGMRMRMRRWAPHPSPLTIRRITYQAIHL